MRNAGSQRTGAWRIGLLAAANWLSLAVAGGGPTPDLASTGPAGSDAAPGAGLSPDRGEASGFLSGSRAHRVEADAEVLGAADLFIVQSTFGYEQTRPQRQWGVSVTCRSLDLDYVPVDFDFQGFPNQVHADGTAVGGHWRERLTGGLAWVGAAGYQAGFTDYRSLWLNEYFRQQFSGLPGYELADPWGASASTGLQWEYLPGRGFLQAEAGVRKDQIAPGYEIDFTGLTRGRPILYSSLFHFAAENLLSPRLRLRHEFRLATTTDREPRYGYQGALNLALGEGCVAHFSGGCAWEAPTLQAFFLGPTLEVELSRAWSLSLAGRYYEDSGEIESTLFSTAAPGLQSYHVGLGLRWIGNRSALRFYLGPYWTSYEPFGLGTAVFAHLYQAREWAIVQVAYAVEF